jgi:hypothetical protein
MKVSFFYCFFASPIIIFEYYLYILTDKRKETHIKSPFTGKHLEIDVWIPNLQLCFEFQVGEGGGRERRGVILIL